MPSQDQWTRITLRLPDPVHERIKAAASSNGRSLNGEIVATLDEKYADAESLETSLAMIERLHKLRENSTSPDNWDHYHRALKRVYQQLGKIVGPE